MAIDLEEVKKTYADNEAEDALSDYKYAFQVLYEHFYDYVKDLNEEELREYLKDLNWDEEDILWLLDREET
jgi:hypothetical protein|tara:strand:+ start:834 stop:1046 length:213 start_codon:yes stop_codon:yes gene_type:complete